MPRPQSDSKRTSIGMSKEIKNRVRICAIRHPTRKGYETDEQVIERIIGEYMRVNNLTDQSPANPTY